MSESHGSQGVSRPSGDSIVGGGFPVGLGDVRGLVDEIPHIVWLSGANGSTEYVNRRGIEYSGLPAEANFNGAWVSFVHADDAARAKAAWEEAVRTQTSFEQSYRIRRADGQFRWHDCRSVPVRGADGAVVRWVGTATDVDGQKTLEENLRRSERQTAETLTLLETMQAAAPVGLAFVDRDFRYARVNDTLAAMAGMTVDEMVERRVAEVIPAAWPQVEPFYRRVLDTGESVFGSSGTGAFGTDPGRVHSWLSSYYPVRVDGEIVGVGLIVVDLTERNDAEAFREVVMENMAEGLYTVDDQGRTTSVNRAALEMLGWTEEELLGRSMHDLVHFQRADGTSIPIGECPMLTAHTEGRSIRVEDQIFTRKDGSMFPVAYSSAPLHVGSTAGGVVVVFRDITEQREQQRRELEERHEQKLESLGRLSAG
ncbi:PAS domain-containing protein, partial [Planosporangium flavigriseum]